MFYPISIFWYKTSNRAFEQFHQRFASHFATKQEQWLIEQTISTRPASVWTLGNMVQFEKIVPDSDHQSFSTLLQTPLGGWTNTCWCMPNCVWPHRRYRAWFHTIDESGLPKQGDDSVGVAVSIVVVWQSGQLSNGSLSWLYCQQLSNTPW